MIKICPKCLDEFKNHTTINGRRYNLQNRKYCLICSPFKQHNTKKIHLPQSSKRCGHSRYYKSMTQEQKNAYNADIYIYQKQQRNKRKIKLVLLKGGQCEKCGYNKNLHALQFHHINPKEKLFNINGREMYSRSMEVLINECNKCQLLCSNCHAEYHYPFGFNWLK